jgi:uncharacterized protein (TIGR03066 family)
MNLTAACLCVMFAAPVPKERADAEKVVGTWRLVASTAIPGGLPNLTLELTQGGKMTVRQSAGDGPVSVYEGEYKVVKNELPYTLKLPGGGVKKETLTIKKLTETQLSVVDPNGIREDFERAKPDKKDEK